MNRRIHTGIDTFIKKIADAMHERRTVLLVLSCVVVFMTTYLLILPAFTLEKDEAAKQGGIDVPTATEENVETDSGSDAEEAVADNNDESAEEEQKVTKQEGNEAPKKNVSAKGESDDSESGASTADNLLYEGVNVKISIDDSKSVLPADASIKVEEIDKDKKEYAKQYEELYKDALTAIQDEKDGKRVSNFSFARFYDISILDGKGSVEPNAAVDVKIEFDKELQKELKVENTDRIRIVHFAEDKKTGEITPEVLDKKDVVEVNTDKKDKLTDTTFKAESFSVYAVVYTVDFHFDLDGESFDYSLIGGGSIGMKELVNNFGILKDEDMTSDNFIEGIEKVEFSDESLVKVVQVTQDTTAGEIKSKLGLQPKYSKNLKDEDIAKLDAKEYTAPDWVLISLKPFKTEETLTVTMINGDVFTIKVTDAQDPFGLDGQSFEIVVNNSRALSPVAETENIGGRDYVFLNDASPSSGSNLAWKFEYDENAFGEGKGGYYISHEGQYLRMIGNNENDTNRTVTLANDKTQATPIAVHYNKDTGKYSFSNDVNGSKGFLCHFNNDYFGIAGSSSSTNAWFELRNPENYKEPGFVSPWDIKSDNIKLKLFDYTGTVGGNNDIDSKWGTDYTADQWRQGTGVNNNRTFLFTGGGRNDSGDPYNYYTGSDPAVMQGIVKDHLNGGYPELTKDSTGAGASLGYLFGAGGQDGVTEYSDGGSGLKGLLRKDENGYYYYSSEQNFAKLNDAKDEILIYSESYNKDKPSANSKKIGLFPFDPYRAGESKAGEEKGPNGSPYNHQFGMTLEAKFVLPPDGKLPNGDDMKFTFSGDDDVWVFIDDVLVLDLGGVHQPLTGTINFAGEGKSEVVDAAVQSVPGQNTIGKSKTLAQIFDEANDEYDDSPYSTHTIKFFYLERGGCDSNCTLSFNLLMYKTLTIAKELEGLTDEERAKYSNKEFDVDVFVNNEPYNGSDTIRYDSDGNVIEQGFEIINGKTKLKPGEKIRIIGLNPKDTFYAAEENGVSMKEFYPPKAERFYTDDSDEEHEEEVGLIEEHKDQSEDVSDWRTQNYHVENTEELMFTNTLREKNLDVEKTWSDGADKHSNDEVHFKVVAKVKVDGKEYDYTDKITALYSDKTVSERTIADVLAETYTLNAANDWKAQLEHLPAVNINEGELFYDIVEIQTANGYASTVTGTDTHNIDVVKIFPQDHTFTDEEIQFKLRKGTENNYKYYNADSKKWGSAGSATVHTLNAENNYTYRFHDMPGRDETVEGVPEGDYSYEQVGDSNPLTEGLSVFDRKLKKFDIENSPFKIKVEKKWDPASLANEEVAGRIVKVTLGRYLLKDIEGNLTIKKEFVPAAADFRANYTVTNTDTGEVFGVYPYVSGGITIDVPAGKYRVDEQILKDDDTYNYEHGESSKTATVPDEGSAEIIFTSTYTPKMGQICIKSTLEANDTGVSFANVKYEIYDAKGNKVGNDVSFAEASSANGKFVGLKLGKYTVREVGTPDTPQNVKAKLKPKNREVSVIIKEGEATPVAEFKATYTKEVVDNHATVHISSTRGNPVVDKTITDYYVGDTIRITYKKNTGETIGNPSITGGQQVGGPTKLDGPDGQYNERYYIDVKITDKNANIAFTNPGTAQYGNYTAMDNNNVSVSLVSAGNRNNSVLSAAKNLLSKLSAKPALRAGAANKSIDITDAGTAPVAPEGKKYVDDTTFKQVVTLQHGHWSEELSNLPTTDDKGNRYYYYIKSVHEENMPSTTTSTIKFGEEGSQYLIGGDVNSTEGFEVTNKVVGSLAITKNVTVDGKPTKTDWADGTYYFTILDSNGNPAKGKVNGEPIGEDGKVSITITNGESNTVTVTDIPVGEYTITEDEPNNGTELTKIDNVVVTSSTVDVSIVDDSTKKSFTNNKKLSDMEETTDQTIEKKWFDDSGEMSPEDVADKSIKYKLTQYRAEVPYNNNESIFPIVIRVLDHSGQLIKSKTYYFKKGAMPRITITKDNNDKNKTIHVRQDSRGGAFSKVLYKALKPDSNNSKEYHIEVGGLSSETLITVQENSANTGLQDIRFTSAYAADNPKDYIEELSKKITFTENSSAEILLDAEEKAVNFTLDGVTYSASDKNWKATIDQLPFYHSKDGKFYVYKYEVTEVEVDGETVTLNQDGTGSSSSYSVTYVRDDDGNTTVKNKKEAVDLRILKSDKSDHNHKLEGAKFTLRRIVENPDPLTSDVQYAEDESKAIESEATDANGLTGFEGLRSGYYEIAETSLPTGYAITGDKAFYIKVSSAGVQLLRKDATKPPKDWTVIDNGGIVYNVTPATGQTPATVSVENTKASELPNSGGIGTTIFYILGTMLVIGSGIFLISRRRIKE